MKEKDEMKLERGAQLIIVLAVTVVVVGIAWWLTCWMFEPPARYFVTLAAIVYMLVQRFTTTGNK